MSMYDKIFYVDNPTELRNYEGWSNAIIGTAAQGSYGDNLANMFWWDSASTATDNGTTIIKATSIVTGRWKIVAKGNTIRYNTAGVITTPVKVWTDIVTPSTSNGYSIDISSAGFTTVLTATVMAIKNNSTANLSPNVSIKSISTTAIVVNVVEGNAATIVILGINVLSGSPLVFANTTGLTLSVEVTGY